MEDIFDKQLADMSLEYKVKPSDTLWNKIETDLNANVVNNKINSGSKYKTLINTLLWAIPVVAITTVGVNNFNKDSKSKINTVETTQKSNTTQDVSIMKSLANRADSTKQAIKSASSNLTDKQVDDLVELEMKKYLKAQANAAGANLKFEQSKSENK